MAGSDISVGMRVSGVSTFVNAMKQSRTAVKQLDAEMALSEAQFEANGNAEEKLAKQSDILKRKIDEQKRAVEDCKKVLEQLKKNGEGNTEAFKSWETALVQNQTALLNTQNKLQGLSSSMGTVSATAKTGKTRVDEMGSSLRNIATITDFSAVKQGIQSIAGVIQTAISGVVNLGKKLWNFEAEQTYMADDLLTRATKYGMSTDELQQWEYAARFVDTEVSAIIGARSKLMNQLGNEFSGTLQIFDGWDGYVALRESNGEMRDMNDIFWDTLSVLGRMGNVTERDARAQELFGRSWMELVPLLEAGRDAWESNAQEAPILSEDEVKRLGEANDALQKLEAQFAVLQGKIASGFAPAFTAVAEALAGVFDRIGDWLDTEEGQNVINSFSEAIVSLLDSFTDQDFEAAANVVLGIINGVADALKWVSQNSSTVVGALGAIFAVFTGLKVTEGITSVLQLVNGLRGLTSGGGQGINIPAGGAPAGGSPIGDVASAAGGGAVAKGLGGAWQSVKAGASKVGNFALNWGPEMLGVGLAAFYAKILNEVSEFEKADPERASAVRSLSKELMHTGWRSPAINDDAMDYETEDAAKLAASLRLYDEEMQHNATESERGSNNLVAALYAKGVLSRNLNFEDWEKLRGKNGIEGQWGTGLDWRDFLSDEYLESIGLGAAEEIGAGMQSSFDALNAAGAAAAAALTAGFAGGIGGGLHQSSQTGNVYIGSYTANNGVDVDTVTSAFIGSMGRAMAGYGGGRR